jgi:peptidoglycan/xylan/chitin deacetylase (PgdA/CDA1 family)
MPPGIVQNELTESKRLLESRRVNFSPVFCYPNGDFNPDTQALVQRAEYRAAITTQEGPETLTPLDPFAIRRICMHEDATKTVPLLALRLITARTPTQSHSVVS